MCAWKSRIPNDLDFMENKMKYYAVKKGKTPGIYLTWDECKAQVNGYKGAVYKKFNTKIEAENFITDESCDEIEIENLPEGVMAAYIDGSFNINTKKFGYGIVAFTKNGKETFSGSSEGDYAAHRNVAGEVLASMEVMKLAKNSNIRKLIIFYDYAGIRHWALGEWKTNLKLTEEYKKFSEDIQKDMELEFRKVEAHTGVKYNEEADKLAKMGCGVGDS